jgi:dienelactone hydrolase
VVGLKYHNAGMHLLLLLACLQISFDYESGRALSVRTVKSESRGAAVVQEITYDAPGGRVPATLVIPRRGNPIAGVLFMHWGLGNRTAFLDEAIALAPAGVSSLLIDAPWMRPGGSDEESRLEANRVQTVMDLRRGVDLLRQNGAKNVGYVGLSFGASVGAMLSAVEPRIKGFVLAGGRGADAEPWIRKATAPVFLQFALHDEYISREEAQRYDEAAPQPHTLKWYEGGHEFNAAARRDRMAWLSTILGFTPVEPTYSAIGMPDAPLSTFGPLAEIAKQGVVIEIPGMQHAPVKRNIAWKAGLKLDVYYPPNIEPKDRLAAILSLPGQAPAEFMRTARLMRFSTTFAQALAARCNRIVIVPDLRSAHTETARYAKLPEVAQDVDDLVAWVRAHAGELQIDPDSLAIVFRSAGWSYGFRTALRDAPPYVKAVVAYYPLLGPYDGASEPFDPVKLFEQGRPLPPILVVTPQHDGWYNAEATRRFLDAADRAGVKVEHIHLPNGGHAFELDNDLEESRAALLRTMLFLRENLPIRRD